MKKLTSSSNMPALALLAGCCGTAARFLLYRTGVDDRGLLVENHPLHILCCVLSIGVVLCLFLAVRKSSPVCAKARLTLALPAAAGILLSIPNGPDLSDYLGLAWLILAIAAAAALVYIHLCQRKDTQPGIYPFAILCLFFAAHLVCRYRVWSGNPQMADYIWQLFACVTLILAFYQKCAAEAGMGNSKTALLMSLLAGYFCLLATPGSDLEGIYLTCGAALLFDAIPTKEEA